MNCKISIAFILFFTTFQAAGAQIKKDWEFRDELISYMQSPKDTIFIQDRKKLEKVSGMACTDSTVTFSYKCKSADSLFISIENTSFVNSDHSLHFYDTIDGKRAFGNNGNKPEKEIQLIKIKWGKTWLIIPDSAFHNLYNTHICLSYLPVEAYVTTNNKYLYLYISASDGAGSYGVKLVFDRTKYVTRIVNLNECSDHFNFLDATEGCE